MKIYDRPYDISGYDRLRKGRYGQQMGTKRSRSKVSDGRKANQLMIAARQRTLAKSNPEANKPKVA